MHSWKSTATRPVAIALAAILAAATTACGGPAAPPAETAKTAPDVAAPATDADAAAAEAAAAEAAAAETAAADAAAAAAAAREQELQAKEVELQLRERELAAKEAAAKTPARSSSPPKTAAAAKPAEPAPAAAPAPPPPPVTVPAGTQVAVKLNSAYSTKTTALGATVNAELASDLVVDGRRVAKAGAPISGSITEVTSGSKKIGAVPALKFDFTQLVVADGTTMPVAIRINQKGESEKGRDTAKIAGGAAAGAIIGNQVSSGKGSVIGGVIGGAAGAIGAQKTGTEVEIPAGTVLSANVRTAFTYSGK